jgi:hypothetical protein
MPLAAVYHPLITLTFFIRSIKNHLSCSPLIIGAKKAGFTPECITVTIGQ